MANNINMHVLHDKLAETFETLYETQKENITKAAELCADAIEMGGVIQVFGSGHSVGFGMEMRNRPGSLVPVHSMVMNDFVIKGIVDLKTFKSQDDIFERKPGIADKLYNLYRTDDNDVFIIISNSGINGVVIDLAIYAKQTGHKVIVVTSWEHTNSENSRHPSGKKLYEFGDVVIDNCGPIGDALLVFFCLFLTSVFAGSEETFSPPPFLSSGFLKIRMAASKQTNANKPVLFLLRLG